MCESLVQSVKAAVETWGSKALPEQQAEDRLAFACEKAPSEDSVTLKLREAFQVSAAPVTVVTPSAADWKAASTAYGVAGQAPDSRCWYCAGVFMTRQKNPLQCRCQALV